MQRELVAHIMRKLTGIPGISKVGGLVQTLTVNQKGTDATALVRLPITFDTFPAPVTAPDNYIEFTPNSAEAGLLYAEHQSLTHTGYEGQRLTFDSRIRVVAWMQQEKAVGLSPLSQCQIDILRRLRPLANFHNGTGGLSRIQVTTGKVVQPEDGLFSRYNYREDIRQYLLGPFGAFGLDLTIKFSASLACLPAEPTVDIPPPEGSES